MDDVQDGVFNSCALASPHRLAMPIVT